MRLGSRVAAAAVLSAASFVLAAVPAAQGATTALVSQPATASTCRYSGNELSAIVAQGPRVKEQDWFRTHHVRQHSRYQASVQRLVGSTWSTVQGTAQTRTPLLAATTTTMPRLTLSVPPPVSGRYRVITAISWIGRSGSVVKRQRLVLTRYSGGASSCAPSIPAPTVSVAGGAGQVPVGTAVGGSFTVSNLRGSGTAYAVLDGPARCDSCAYDSAQTFQVPVSGNGTFALPAGTLSASGVYRWDVVVISSAQTSADSWSSAMYAQETVGYSVTTGTNDASLNRSLSAGAIQERLQFNGFHYGTEVDWTATMWGPYATLTDADNAACTGTAHRTFASGNPVIDAGGATIGLSQSASFMNGGQPAFWRVSVAANVAAPYAQTEAVPAKFCSATFHTLK